MTDRQLTPALRNALLAMLKAPLRRARHVSMGDGWIAQDEGYHALVIIRTLVQRGWVQPPMRMAVLTIAGRQQARRIAKVAA
jgi:hypothetical protein